MSLEKLEYKIYLILKIPKNKRLNDYQQEILSKLKPIKNLIKIKLVDLYFDSDFEEISKLNDYVFFDKNFAYNNIDVIKSYNKSIVLINNKTVYFRKINQLNPINEELAINHNFKLAYLNPKIKENTNSDYKIIVDEKNYLFDLKKFIYKHFNK